MASPAEKAPKTYPLARLAAAVASGLALALAFPRAGWWFLAWVGMVPLFLAARGVSGKRAFTLGFAMGFAHFLGLTYWVETVMRVYGHLPVFASVPITLLLAAYLALYPALFTFLYSRADAKSPAFAAAAAPAFWVALEYVRAHMLTGFPWALLGYSQAPRLSVVQVADLSGVYLISGLLVLSNAALALLFARLAGKRLAGRRMPSRRAVAALCLAALAMAGADLAYGRFRLGQVDALATSAPKIRVAVLQGNVDQTEKWDPAFQEETLNRYSGLSARAALEGARLIVLPETALPFYFGYDLALSNRARQIAMDARAWVLAGSPGFTQEEGEGRLYNSAYLLTPRGDTADRYDKVHLVPYGEYVPLKRIFFFLGKLVEEVGDFSTGDKGRTLPMDEARLGVLICYEVIFPELGRAAAENNANLLVTITNDAWFGKSTAPYQHFGMASFRSVETRRSLARAANTGISGFVDPGGRVLAATDLFTRAERTASLPLLELRTVYVRYGDFFAVACLALAMASTTWLLLRGKKEW